MANIPVAELKNEEVREYAVYMANVNEGYSMDGIEKEYGTGENELPRVNPVCSMTTSKRKSWFKFRPSFCANFLIAVAVGAFIILHEFNIIPHHKGGFYCKDPKLSFPFNGDSVSLLLLIVICTILPAIIMLTVEILQYRPEKYSMSNVRCKTALKNVYRWYGEYVVSCVFSIFLMEIIKGIVGEPRPHFLDTCKPDKAVNCTPGAYITDYVCTNTEYSKWFVYDSIKSFPSGHTALGLFMSIYIFTYLEKRACSMRPILVARLFQLLIITWGLTCSFTRIMDNRHHWWDVLGGAVLGAILSYHNIVVLCKNFKCSNPHLARSVASNGDAGKPIDNHHTSKNLINRSNIISNDFDTGLRQIT